MVNGLPRMVRAGDATNTCLRCESKQVRNLSASAGLPREDSGKALRLLDDAIALAISEQVNQGVLTPSHHVAVISTFIGNLELVKHNIDNPSRQIQRIPARCSA